jgi:hypothetical protein
MSDTLTFKRRTTPMPKHEDEKHEEKAAAHQEKVADRHEEKAAEHHEKAAEHHRRLRSTIEKPLNVTKRVITKRQGITPTLLMGIT